MTTPRHLLIAPQAPGYYHLISRCVRRSWLCGQHHGRNYSHRRAWLIERLNHLANAFAIDVHAYAIMSNHFHLVIYSDPTEPQRWSDHTVVDRWLDVCPPTDHNNQPDPIKAERLRQRWLADPNHLQQMRSKLGSVSVFMKLLKQPIARRANREDDCTGHFFEQRFYSGALLDDDAILATMAYVDLNPIRARITEHLESSRDTSIEQRLLHSTDAAEAYLQPVMSGRAEPTVVPISLQRYTDLLQGVSKRQRQLGSPLHDRLARQLSVIRRRQRAYGALPALMAWLGHRHLALREQPLV